MQELFFYFFFAVLAGSFLRMDALMWRCAGWAGRGIIHHLPLAGGSPSSAEDGEEGLGVLERLESWQAARGSAFVLWQGERL